MAQEPPFCKRDPASDSTTLTDSETILGYIRRTRSSKGFHCRADLDETDYPTGYKVTPEEKAWVRLKPRRVWPRWNYTIWPHSNPGKC